MDDQRIDETTNDERAQDGFTEKRRRNVHLNNTARKHRSEASRIGRRQASFALDSSDDELVDILIKNGRRPGRGQNVYSNVDTGRKRKRVRIDDSYHMDKLRQDLHRSFDAIEQEQISQHKRNETMDSYMKSMDTYAKAMPNYSAKMDLVLAEFKEIKEYVVHNRVPNLLLPTPSKQTNKK
jgi:hypothetical protein